MKKLIGILALIVTLAVIPTSVSANTINCKHPATAKHHGEVLPLEIYEEIIDNEIYIFANNAPVGCPYLVIEEKNGETVRTHPPTLGLNPDINPEETICYTVEQLRYPEEPRVSNRICVTGFRGERI